jgi:hypothetical protein
MRSTKARHSGEYIASLSLMSDGILSARSFPGRKFPCRGGQENECACVCVCVCERERESVCVGRLRQNVESLIIFHP